jgi:hypothetical protein
VPRRWQDKGGRHVTFDDARDRVRPRPGARVARLLPLGPLGNLARRRALLVAYATFPPVPFVLVLYRARDTGGSFYASASSPRGVHAGTIRPDPASAPPLTSHYRTGHWRGYLRLRWRRILGKLLFADRVQKRGVVRTPTKQPTPMTHGSISPGTHGTMQVQTRANHGLQRPAGWSVRPWLCLGVSINSVEVGSRVGLTGSGSAAM